MGTSGLSLSPAEYPALKEQVGKTLITTDGTTLLGGDDKAGVAEILCAAAEILKEGKLHGTVKIGFTPDEEIGEGADHFDAVSYTHLEVYKRQPLSGCCWSWRPFFTAAAAL